MYASAALVLAIAGSAMAQTTSAALSTPSSTSGCGTQIDTIIASCLSSMNAQLQSCATNDWDCMCTQQTNVLVCYDNCRSDPARFAAESQQTSWCNAAKQYSTTTTAAVVKASTTASSGMSQTSGVSPTGTINPSASSASDAANPTNTNAAMANVVPGALVAFLGLAVLM